jgi:afadin
MDNFLPPSATPAPRSPSEMSQLNGGDLINKPFVANRAEPEIQKIRLVKSNQGMGLSIVAAKGVGKDRLGIYIKAVVEGGAAWHDGRLQAGDQLLQVSML